MNAHLFESVVELRAVTETWLRIYNRERPHDRLGRVPPLAFLPRPSSVTFTRPWKIEMPLYRRLDKGMQILDFSCVELSEEILYGHQKD